MAETTRLGNSKNLTVWGLAGRPFGSDKQSDFRVPKPDSPPHVASYAVCAVNRVYSVTARPFIHVVRDRYACSPIGIIESTVANYESCCWNLVGRVMNTSGLRLIFRNSPPTQLMSYQTDTCQKTFATRFAMAPWTFSWSRIFLRLFFPGNLVWKVRRGESSTEISILARAYDGMDETASCGRDGQKRN